MELNNISTRTLDGLGSFGQLNALSLYQMRQLDSLEGLQEAARTLKDLEISQCGPNRDFSPISKLDKLRTLGLIGCGEIPSLDFVLPLSQLEYLTLEGTTSISDGRIAMLRQMPRLRGVFFKNRLHYDARQKDFPFIDLAR